MFDVYARKCQSPKDSAYLRPRSQTSVCVYLSCAHTWPDEINTNTKDDESANLWEFVYLCLCLCFLLSTHCRDKINMKQCEALSGYLQKCGNTSDECFYQTLNQFLFLAWDWQKKYCGKKTKKTVNAFENIRRTMTSRDRGGKSWVF